jgi:TPR repeat protein
LKGDRDAMFALARIYHRGTRVPTDYTEALRWYRLAALRGHPEARRTLALILANPSTNESIDAAWMHFLASGVPPEIALAVLASRQEMLAEREPLYSLETLHLEPVSSNTTTCEVLP